MAEGKYRFDAGKAYKLICDTLDEVDFRYHKDDEQLSVTINDESDGLPIQIRMWINEKTQMVSVISRLPFTIAEDKRVEFALAVCYVNSEFTNGCFDYEASVGTIAFRMSNPLRECELTSEIVRYMMLLPYKAVENYGDKFLMFNKGLISLEQLLDFED